MDQSVERIENAQAVPVAPNILIIVTDDQSVGTMRRDVMPKTRFYLRRQGRTYTNFFVTAPICCPSRATIMTGRYNHNNGVTGNTRERFRLDFDSTLQHYLSEAGYQTWISGKFLNAWSIRYAGRPPAWDRYTITRGGSHHNTWFRHGQGDGPGRRFMYRPYADQLIERQALRYVRRTEESDAQPWFGFLSLTIPHGPPIAMDHYADLRFAARRPNRAERERSIADKWPGYAEHGIQGNPRFISKAWIVQLQMLRHADDVIGRVMAQLGDQNERRRAGRQADGGRGGLRCGRPTGSTSSTSRMAERSSGSTTTCAGTRPSSRTGWQGDRPTRARASRSCTRC
jgi:arylsulfatase A-like enzyme